MMALAISGTLFAQVPQKFNYQGIARDTKGNPMAQQRMTLKLTVLPTADATTGEYEEIQTVTTNEFGLYTLQIGNGTPLNGEMKAVKWETGNKYIKVAIDPKGGNDFVDAGTNQLLSVPYAIYADKAGTAKNTGGGDRLGAVSTSASGTGTVNYLTKFTAANTIYNSQLFDNGTNIGIGTTSPAARLHLYSNVAGVQQHIRMQNASATGAGRFRMDNDGTLSYATFSKYGTAYASGYPGIPALYPYANLLAFGNNGVVADDGLGRFLISNGGNIGLSIFKGGTSKLKFHADYATENVGIGGNAAPVSRVHLNNTDGTSMDLRLTNTTTLHTATDGMSIAMSGNNASINNRENAPLTIGTNNTTRMTVTATGNVELANQIKIAGGAPGAGKVLTSDATGLATWTTPSITSVGGTTNYIPKYTPNGTTLGNSALKDSTTYGLMYNAAALPSGFYNYHYNIPVGSAYYNSFYNIHQPNSYHNYITMTNNSTGSGYLGMILGDSSTVNRWFAVSSSAGDSVGAFYKPGFGQNTVFMGSSNNNGMYVQLQNGKMGNTALGNAHFNINTNYDTAGHFTSSSTNGLYNGILRAEYTNTNVFDHVAVYGKSVPNVTTNYGIGVSGVGGYYGVQGYSVITGSGNYGASGTAISNGSSYGLTGYAGDNGTLGGNKYGTYTQATGGTNNYGLYSTVPSFSAGNGTGVYALGKQTGVYGQADSASANQTTQWGLTYGNKEAIGVFGVGNASSSSINSQNVGVAGSSTNSGMFRNFGVYGEAMNGTGYNAAIVGYAPAVANSFAGYFNGNVDIAGNLAKSSGTFKIDHPQDPANKYLIHSFVESPDMMNVYNGNITTDANGIATVSLPSYFEAENKDFKYQLTVVDNSADFIMAKVSEKVSNNTFKIKTSKPNVEVSWQVTGVRQDAYANAHRIVDVVDKAPEDKGYYIHPELFGAPATQTVGPKGNPTAERHLLPSAEDHKKAMEDKKRNELEHLQKQQEAEKNWKQQESPKNTTKGTNGNLAPSK